MKRNIFYWALYDFANSILLIAFLFYFSQWLVVEHDRPAWWYNGSLILSSALFILTAPTFSRKIDITGKKIAGLRMWTLLSAISMGAVSLIAVYSNSLDVFATVLFMLGTYAYLMCFLYFTPMLNDLSTRENRGRISGFGQGMNSLGQVTGLLVTFPFVNGTITLFGEPGRAQALLPSVILFGVFALPILFWYREEGAVKSLGIQQSSGYKSTLALLKTILTNKSLAILFLAYFLFSDALITFANNFPLYLQVVHGVTDTVKALLTIAILGLAAVGAIVFGYVSDRYGHKSTLISILIIYSGIFIAMALIQDFKTLIPIFLLAGILFGPVWGISRAMVGQLSPPNLLASSYSYYVVAERFATFIGPAIWSVVLIQVGENTQGYKWALVSMSVLILLSLLAMRKVSEPPALVPVA